MYTQLSVEAEPHAYHFASDSTALVVIDMQNAFSKSEDSGLVQNAIPHVKELLRLFRELQMHVFHTRETYQANLSDCPSTKLHLERESAPKPGDLVSGQPGHAFMADVGPIPGENVIGKAGHGAFWNTRLLDRLKAREITHLVLAGVPSQAGFQTTLREAYDRGFHCCIVTNSSEEYTEALKTYRGVGFVAQSSALQTTLNSYASSRPKQDGSNWGGDLSIKTLSNAYRAGLPVLTVVRQVFKNIRNYSQPTNHIFILLLQEEDVVKKAEELERKHPDPKSRPPLFGIPFTVKDSINVAGLPTTTGCPALSYVPSESAPFYQRVIDQGGLLIGKNNMEQLGTGMTGCRSPYGTLHSVYHPEFTAGGSSSGSSVSVAGGLVTFSLCTDTAGSVRLPAAFHGIVGLKPTLGTVSARGVTPACPSLDCMSVVARSIDDARRVWWECEGYDDEDVYAKPTPTLPRHVHALGPETTRFRFGVPSTEALEQSCPIFQQKFTESVSILQSVGGEIQPIDWTPFEKAGELLYERTFVSERIAALPDGWIEQNREHMHPVTRKVFEGVLARNSTAVEAYRDLMDKAKYTREIERIFRGVDALVVPSSPVHWKIEEVDADPIRTNSILGTYAHFANVLDMMAVAVPAGTHHVRELGERAPRDQTTHERLPFSITILGRSGTDAEILQIASRFETAVASLSN